MTNILARSWLWQTAFVERRPDVSADEQAFFRLQLEAMRERTKALVARIPGDMPGLTVHDETHLDALWEIASLVATRSLAFNAPEAFVFGSAVLLHDTAMTLAAYPGGLDELKTTTAWADTSALHGLRPSKPGRLPSLPPSPELEAKVTSEVLRRLHAEKAAELATQGWRIREEQEELAYLIGDSDLRRFYGATIGAVAHSHWWSLGRVERDLDRILGPLPPKTRHGVDLLKLACLLRVADALHLDSRRAPRFVRALEQPRGISALHWTFQERLAFPQLDGDAVVFSAGEPFSVEDADAWWLAYDSFAMADRELRDADLLLRNRREVHLAARRVKGAGDAEETARHIPVSGWLPVETRVRVSDIPSIVETLGGNKLYGDDPTAPVRELVQNGMDAIQARRRLQDRRSWGRIKVELSQRNDGFWLTVEDDGVGMSQGVLTGALLDFGSSFWRSPRIAEEFPGLAAKGMDAIGRFGIGFFSVFMLGDHVRVITRRYDRAECEALALEFRAGLRSRPILSPALPGSAPLDGGTRVQVRLQGDPRGKNGRLHLLPTEHKSHRFFDLADVLPRPRRSFSSLADLVRVLAPASDVTIETAEFGQERGTAVAANDWLAIQPEELLRRILPADALEDPERIVVENLMRTIAVEGTVYGRAALWPRRSMWPGVLTSGGLRVTDIPHVLGIMVGEVVTAARDAGRLLAPLAEWATEQARLVEASALPPERKALCAEVVLECGGKILGLPLARWGGAWLNSDELRERFAREENEVALFTGDVSYDEDADFVPKQVFEQSFEPNDGILWIPELHYTLTSLPLKGWYNTFGRRPSHLTRLIEALLRETWGDYYEREEDLTIGRAGGEDIIRFAWIFARHGSAAEVASS